MKMYGWCERCKRLRQVRITRRSLLVGGVPVGVCDDCEEKLIQQRKERAHGR